MRAGEGESEAADYVLTNPVAKTSMSSGLSKRGTLQARGRLAAAVQNPLISPSCGAKPHAHMLDIFACTGRCPLPSSGLSACAPG